LRKERFKLAHVEQALRDSGGIAAMAARKLAKMYGSCTAQTVRNYMNRYPSLKKAIDEVIENNLDLAEGALLRGITQGNMTAVIYYLKTKGKHRGYIERLEQTGANGEPLHQPAQVMIYIPDNGRDPDIVGALQPLSKIAARRTNGHAPNGHVDDEPSSG